MDPSFQFKAVCHLTSSRANGPKYGFRILVVLMAGVFVTVLGVPPVGAADTTGDQALYALADEFLLGYFEFQPNTASSLGLHEYDGRVPDYRAAALEREHSRLRSFDSRLSQIDNQTLSATARIDQSILRAGIREQLFEFEGDESYWRNPLTYPRALTFNAYLTRNYAPIATRVRSLISVENQAAALFAAARQNLRPVLPRPFVETAIKVSIGAADFLRRDLPLAVHDLKDAKLLEELHTASQQAERELRSYANWLENERLPQSHHRFALGRDKYARMLRDVELVNLGPEEILEIGMRELDREQAAFDRAAKRIDVTRPPIDVFRSIQNDHPTAENLIKDTSKNLEAIRTFVVDQRLITVPSEVRAIVAETPAFRRATSFASMNSPGPFETNATEAYYYVTPVDPAWTAEKQHEWLTAFNYYTTDVVSIHEAYPGHYVQHLHLNRSPVHRVRKVFSSYAFVEGWAHYTEQMVLDEGFPGENDDHLAAKYRLAQSDESLLRLCRLAASIQMHCGEMTIDEATKFFQERCHYQEQPARQEAERGAYDPGYLNYALGKLMILKLRDDWRRQEGERFTLQRFHDEMLRHGMPPLPLLRRIMLNRTEDWDKAL